MLKIRQIIFKSKSDNSYRSGILTLAVEHVGGFMGMEPHEVGWGRTPDRVNDVSKPCRPHMGSPAFSSDI